MEEWQELQQREQALTDQHRSAQQALQHDFMRKHDALERQFERDRQAIETSKAHCMARMAAQAAASAAGRSHGSALLQWPAAPAATAALSWTRLAHRFQPPAACAAFHCSPPTATQMLRRFRSVRRTPHRS